MASARWNAADVAKKTQNLAAVTRTAINPAQDPTEPAALSERKETAQTRPPRLRPGYGVTTWPDGGARFVAHSLTPDQLRALQQAAAAAGVPNLTPKP